MWNLLVTAVAASDNELKNHILASLKYFPFSEFLSAVILHHVAVK